MRARRPDQTDEWFKQTASNLASMARQAEQAFESLDAPGVPALLRKLIDVQDAAQKVMVSLMVKQRLLPPGSKAVPERIQREHDRKAHARHQRRR